ncbi:MAG: hypothetical protein L7F77_08630 [Candidatus Magnetominusculus sp. LBB02]|nr:hypothetical protein [Candidatus Magnetominusculus sp. LBB02]
MMSTFKNLRILSLCILLYITMAVSPPQTNAEWADWILDTSLSTEYKDNVNYMFASEEKRGDFITSPTLSLGRYYQIADYTRLRLTANISGEIYALYHKLDSVMAGTSFAIVQKLGVGHEIPWIAVNGSASYLAVSDSNRDGMIYTVGTSAGWYVNERIDLQAGYLFTARRGKNLTPADAGASGAVYDLNSHRISLIANFLAASRLVITPGYSFNTGDFVSSACGDYTEILKEYSKANTLDRDYGEPMWTYKMSGHSHDFSLAASYAINSHLSLNSGYSYVFGYAKNWFYNEKITRFAIMYSY